MVQNKRSHLPGRIAVAFLILALVLVTAGSTGAAPNADNVLVPSADVYVDKTSAVNKNGQTLDIAYSASPAGNNPTKVVFLKFDLSPVNYVIQSAQLSMYALSGVCGSPTQVTIGVFPVTDNSWTEGALVWPGPNASGSALTTLTTTTTAGRQNTAFNAALGSWLESQRAGGTATLRLEITSATTADFLFDDREQAGKAANCAVAAQDVTQPQLTVTSTTAVSMSTLQATGPAVNWPLIVGLGVLALVVIGGLAVSRRRAAAR